MKTKNKLFSLLSMLLLLFFLFSCGKDDATGNNGSGEDDSSGAAEAQTSEGMQTAVPKDLQFDGAEIRILNCSYYTEDSVFINATEEIGEIVNDEIYKRNSRVQNDLNVKFKFTDISIMGGENFNKMVTTAVMAGTDDWDLLIDAQHDCVTLTMENVLMNLMDAPYIDLSKPWWPDEYIREIAIGKSNLYFLTGDISMTFVRNMGCVYFNKELYANYFGNPDDMYKTVLEGKWTLDKLSEMGRTLYKDLNGNGEYDDEDQYASGVLAANLADHFAFDAGLRITARDEEGLPYFVINNEKTASLTEKLYELYYENEGTRVFPPTNESNNITIPKKFMSNELLFDFGWFYISEFLRDMKTDYGIIPFPKYDESQPSYLSLAQDIVPFYCIPKTCSKTEAVCAILESMAFESHKTVLPAYFEVALKLKYTRDATDDAFRIIDIIHDNCITDFAYIYTLSLNRMGDIMRQVMASKSPYFVSTYEKVEPKAQTNLENLIDAYLQNSD